jgi:integrase/recombinase XerC
MPINLFIKYLEVQKRASKHTISAYQTDLVDFSNWYKAQSDSMPNWDQLSQTDFRQWVVFLVKNQFEPKSIKRKITAISSFYSYCEKHHNFGHNPVKGLTLPKISKKLPVFLTQTQTDQLLSEPIEDEFEPWRNYLIICLLYSTGIRREELINLTENQVDLSKKQLQVIGKGNKQRNIPILPYLEKVIAKYKNLKKNEGFCHQNLIVSNKGKKIYPMLVYRIVNEYIRIVSTASKKSPHVLRHTFATQMLNNGADINAIKELLGHASLAATQIYTHNSITDLKNIFNQAHPRGESHK